MSTRAAYKHFMRLNTRWKDNDIYGHVNNVEYYSYFDTVINAYLINSGALDIHTGPVIGLCAESHCKFLDSLAFPQAVDAGLRVAHLGKSSVRYEIGLFAAANEATAAEGKECCAAEGWFVHVFVDRATRKSTPLPDALRAALAALQVEATV